MKIKLNQYIFILLLSILVSSCATIFSGSYQKIKVDANQRDSRILVNGIDQNMLTPNYVRLSRKQKHSSINQRSEIAITLKKEGFRDTTIYSNAKLNGSVFLNFISWGPLGLIVDAATGAAVTYDKSLYASLTPLPFIPAPAPVVKAKLSVTNSVLEAQGDLLIITYDLLGDAEDMDIVWVDVSDAKGGRINAAQSFSGDVGAHIKKGYRKRIVWDMKKDGVNLEGQEIDIEVKGK